MAGFGIVPACAGDSGDNSTNIEQTDIDQTNIEQTSHEETDVEVYSNTDDIIKSAGPVIYQEENTEINDIDNTDITEITTLENSSQDIDNSYHYTDNSSYEYTDNSRTNITDIETTNVNIDNSKNTNVAFTESSVVNNINFVSKDSGKTKVIVKEVYEKPPVENVYKSFNIWIDNKDVATNVENAAVDFKVEKTWLIENNLDSSTIILNMYEGDRWIEVPVKITGEDSQYVYFTAEVSGYSTFAISSKTVTVDKVLKQTNTTIGTVSDDEIDEPTKSVIIKMLEFIIELLEGK